MKTETKDIIQLPGEICEIIKQDGNTCQVKILCKPKYLLFECGSGSDIHLGEKVILTLKIESKDISPVIISNELSDNN